MWVGCEEVNVVGDFGEWSGDGGELFGDFDGIVVSSLCFEVIVGFVEEYVGFFG